MEIKICAVHLGDWFFNFFLFGYL